MPRRLPPVPKERAVSLATSSAPRTVPTVSVPREARGNRRDDMVGLVVFVVLVVLGLLASARAFLVM